MSAPSRFFGRLDRLHAESDAAAVAAGWTTTRTRWGGRSYGWTIPTAPAAAQPARPAAVVADVVDLNTYRSTRSTRPAVTAPTYGDAA